MQARLLDSILLPRPHAFKLYILYIFLSIGNSSFYTFLSTFLLMFMRHVTKALRCNIGLSKKSCPDNIATGTAFFIFYFASESSDLENAFEYSSSKSSVSISASVSSSSSANASSAAFTASSASSDSSKSSEGSIVSSPAVSVSSSEKSTISDCC